MNMPQYSYPGDENALSDVASGIYGLHHDFKNGDVVLDVGAHVGFFTQWVLPRITPSGKVIAIEPHPRNFFELKSSCGNFSNVELVNAAAGLREGTQQLWNNAHNSGAHSLYKTPGYPYLFEIPVPAINLGLLCKQRGLKPTFVKIDTEGAEAVILSTLLSAGIICDYAVEVHSEILADQCCALFDEIGIKTILKGSMLYVKP